MEMEINDLNSEEVYALEQKLKDEAWHAVEQKDEKKLKEAIVRAMKLFLADKSDAAFLESLALTYMTAPIHLGWKDKLSFGDKKLDYVCEELSNTTVKDPSKTKDIVKRCLLYLEGKEYENIADLKKT